MCAWGVGVYVYEVSVWVCGGRSLPVVTASYTHTVELVFDLIIHC